MWTVIIVMLMFYFLGAAWTGVLPLLGSIPVVENVECGA